MKTDKLKSLLREIKADLENLDDCVTVWSWTKTLKDWCNSLIDEDIDSFSYSEAVFWLYESSKQVQNFVVQESTISLNKNQDVPELDSFLIYVKLKKINDELANRWRRAVLLGCYRHPYKTAEMATFL